MSEREDLPLIGMHDEVAKKGETKSRPKSGVATIGSPKAAEEKPVHRRETTRLPAPVGARIPPPKPAPPKPPPSEAEVANAAAETAVEEVIDLSDKPAPAPKAKAPAPKPVAPSETDAELDITEPAPEPPKREEAKPRQAFVSKPTVVLKGDPEKAEAKPAIVSEPTARREAVNEEDPEALLEHLRHRVREAKGALVERDEARTRVAKLEHELAQANERLARVAELEEQVREVQQKLDASVLSAKMLGEENATLKQQVAESEKQFQKLDERIKTAEATLKKNENALANAKEARDDASYKVEAVMALLQGRPVPPKPERK
jgi:hypothetical protein